jgi:tetratricopeptide (TPR) repeat protein
VAKKTKTGRELEIRVANAYRAMGARRVEHDVELAGNQIDVYVELETPGRLLHRIAVEAKDYNRPVGIDIVNDFALIAKLLRSERLIDEGAIVSAKGFSKQARNAAQTYDILLLEPADLDAMAAEAMAVAEQIRPAFLAETQDMVSSGRTKRRRTVAIGIILAVAASLILTLLTQPYDSSGTEDTALPIGSLLWIMQVLVSFIAILGSVLQLIGVDVRELFSSRQAGASAEAFPFHVIRDFDELLDYLFPDPTTPVLSDRSIRFLPRIADELDTAFRQRRRVLVQGRSKTGKTREVIELLRRWWYTGPTVLLAKNHVGLYPPYKVPATLPVRNLVLLFDDVDRYCGDADAVKRLDQTIDFFADLCHDPGELRVVATARQEPEFWRELHYDESDPLWNTFSLIPLPPLPPDGARQLINRLAQDCGMSVDSAVVEDLAIKNDGTFLNLALAFRGWLHEGVKQVGPGQAAAFEGNLLATWRRRYERLVKVLPEAGPIYAAVDLLQTLDVPLRPALIAELATEMSMGRTYHIVSGLFHRIRSKVELSPWLDWYRTPRRRLLGFAFGALVSLLLLYGFFYMIFCVTSIDFQKTFFTAIGDNLGWQLLILSPLMAPLIPLSLSLILRLDHRWSRRRVQRTLDRLLETEVPLRGEELRPYEGQFEGNGTSRTWVPAFFAGEGKIIAFSRLTASRLASVYLAWSEGLRRAGELGPARSLARLASTLAPSHPVPSFVLGMLWYDEGDFGRALAEFEHSRKLNPTAGRALALERSAWCHYQLDEFAQTEIAAGQALTLMPSLAAARWARGLARLQQGQIEPGLADCRQAALAKDAPPPDLAATLDSALAAASPQDWANQASGFFERDRSTRKRRMALWRRLKWGGAVGLALVLVVGFLLGAPYVSPQNLAENADFSLSLMNSLLVLYPRAPALIFMRGYAYDRIGEYKLSIADYTEVILLDPEYALAYNNRGIAYAEMGDYEQAIADYTEAIRLDPKCVLAYNNRGIVYAEMGEYELAIADYTEVIRLDPEHVSAYHNRALNYERTGEYEQALADYTEAIRRAPDPTYPYCRRGSFYAEMGNYEQAIADYTEAIHVDPNYAYAYQRRGDAYRAMGEYELAVADCTEAIRVDSDDAYHYCHRGDFYAEMGDYGRAIADYTEAIHVDPDDVYGYCRRGDAYLEMGDYEQAIADYTEVIRLNPEYTTMCEDGSFAKRIYYCTAVIRLNPNDADAYARRGDAYAGLSNYEQAIADYMEAIRLNPEYATMCEDGNFARRIHYCTAVIRLNPNDADAYAKRGDVYARIGNYEQAIADYIEAIRLDPEYATMCGDSSARIAYCTAVIRLSPNDADAYAKRGKAYVDLGAYEQAIADYTEVIRLDPEHAEEYKDAGGWKAIAYYTESIRLNPNDSTAYVGLGDTYHEWGNYEQAIADYTEAIRVDPNYVYAYQRRGDAYAGLHNYEQAIADYIEGIHLDPEHAEEYKDAGGWKAVAYYTEAVRLNPNDTKAYAGHGDAYAGLGNYEQAIADYTEAIHVDPNYAYAYQRRGDAYRAIGEYELAIADCTEAIRLDPDSVYPYYTRGDAYVGLGNREQAIADYTEGIRLDPEYAEEYKASSGRIILVYYVAYYTEAIRLNPNDAEAYFGRGIAYSWMGDCEQAIADFTEAIRLSPDDAVFYQFRGTEYYSLGDYEQAIADFTEAIRVDPNYDSAYYYRGYAYDEIGEYKLAIADFGDVIRLGEKYSPSYVLLGEYHRQAGEYEAAVLYCSEAIKLDYSNSRAYVIRGSAYAEMSEYEKAIADWKLAIELYEEQGDTEKAEEVRSLLSTLED